MSMEATLLFDGGCGLCTRVAEWGLDHAREPFAAVPFQRAAPDRYGLTMDQARDSVWWIEGNLQLDGHRAIAEMLRACREPWPLVGRAIRFPPASWASALLLDVILHLRGRLPGGPPALDGEWDPYAGRT